jgi:glycosyltransferase involved in cell wall biosynthesis
MNILFYTTTNARSRDTESLMFRFKQMGHQVYFITQAEGRHIKEVLDANGIHVFSEPVKGTNRKLVLLKQCLFLISFCWKYKIDVVFSHLEPANFIAVLCQYFIKAKVVVGRHHVDEMELSKKASAFSYRFVYSKAKYIIAVSERAKQFMVEKERVVASKIDVIRLAYDFALYNKVNIEEVKTIKATYQCELLLVTVCRMLPDKRPDLSVELLQKMLKEGVNAKLILLGEGPFMDELNGKIRSWGLEKSCFLLGRKNNVLDYLSAADILLNPSLIDSSSVVVKEAGLVKKTVVVCKAIGDCDSYIESLRNGILVDKDTFVEEAFNIIKTLSEEDRVRMGEELFNTINQLFSIDNNIQYYKKYIH